jgi:hypothetical protein
MRKLFVAVPATLVLAAVLTTGPVSMLSTVSEAKEITLAQKENCAANARVCSYLGCDGLNPDTGMPAKGVKGLSGSALQRCHKDCDNRQLACLKTGSWPTKVISSRGGTDVKTKPGGVATVPKTPDKHSGGTLPKGPGGGVVTQPKWSPKSPPIGTYHPRPPLSTTGPVGTWHSGGSPKGGPILLRSTGRR